MRGVSAKKRRKRMTRRRARAGVESESFWSEDTTRSAAMRERVTRERWRGSERAVGGYGPDDADDEDDRVASASDERFADLRPRRRSAGFGDGGPARERAPRS